ncbi:MAG TPA: ATP-binding protein [Blastocatellia bacterium]|jgi:signal transduction histidine kinase/ActR/RegA family two-component response regulator
MRWPVLTVTIKYEHDVVAARRRARQIAGLLGFEAQDQSRIATAVSEIARNAFNYADGGRVEFQVEGEATQQTLLIEVKDKGPGIADLESVLQGQYRSATGMGLGIMGARRLMDVCEISSSRESGTKVLMKKTLPKRGPVVTAERIRELADQLANEPPQSLVEEIQQQNGELMRLLDELRRRQDELERLNRELEDTNLGVIALYAELDEKASDLRRAGDMKSSFLSNMSHEFRTPLNSIMALTQLLLSRSDGDLTEEQDKQVNFIRKGATTLLEMVGDLLDLAKIEAGKVDVRPSEFTVENLFSALRGVFRPMLTNKSIDLVFEEVGDIPALDTDEGKVTQILRNFISNSLKFTERGEVRVRAALTAEGDNVTFYVADTGLGIAAADQARIFEEFTQIENPLQSRAKGTGLGLPLSRRLARLLGGDVTVESSEIGVGSTFSATIPVRYSAKERGLEAPAKGERLEIPRPESRLLLIDDEESARYLIKKMLGRSPWVVDEAASGEEGIRMAREAQPNLILLDLKMPGLSGLETLSRLKSDPLTSETPVVIVTSQTLTSVDREDLMDRAQAILSKDALSQEGLVEAIMRATGGCNKEAQAGISAKSGVKGNVKR